MQDVPSAAYGAFARKRSRVEEVDATPVEAADDRPDTSLSAVDVAVMVDSAAQVRRDADAIMMAMCPSSCRLADVMAGSAVRLHPSHAVALVRSHLRALSGSIDAINAVVCTEAPWYVVCPHCQGCGHFHFECSRVVG